MLGHSQKVIAGDLGVGISTVSTHLAHLTTKLKARGRAQLMAVVPSLFSPTAASLSPREGPRLPSPRGNCSDPSHSPLFLSMQRFGHDAKEWVLLSFPVIPARFWERLTSAECAVVTLVLRGCTNAQIAKQRRRSDRTVANQVFQIFKKLGVSSRAELLSSVLRPGADDGCPADADRRSLESAPLPTVPC